MSNRNSDSDSDETEHTITADAFVPTKVQIRNDTLEPYQQIDFVVKKWKCSCGASWDFDESEAPKEHLREHDAYEKHEVDGDE
jgi:hypothetical protein